MTQPYALIIDDNPANLDVLEQLLAQEGVASVPVLSPHEVANTIDQMPRIDVVFLDLEFPNGSGFNIIELLHSDERLANVPIVAYTVHISELNEVRDAGFHSFLGKPLDIENFPDQLSRILAGEQVWETSQ